MKETASRSPSKPSSNVMSTTVFVSSAITAGTVRRMQPVDAFKSMMDPNGSVSRVTGAEADEDHMDGSRFTIASYNALESWQKSNSNYREQHRHDHPTIRLETVVLMHSYTRTSTVSLP
jgi:hypothetical protein